MRAVNAVLTGVLFLSLTIAVEARSLRQSRGPAEVPPASFKGTQYVDSKGCAYIRAGYGGNVQWVPRVTRKKQVICGQRPSGVAGTSTPKKTQPKRTQVAAVQPQPSQASAAPQTPKRKVVNWNWFGNTKARTVAKPPAAKTKTTYGTPAKPTRVATTAPVKAKTRYQRGPAIRHVPQAVHPADHLNGRATRAAGTNVQVARAQYALPEGYKSLLSETAPVAQRGVGTAQGQAQMDLIWTQTTPRRLIDVTTGRDMTAQLPQIRYPYTAASTRSYVASSAGATVRRSKRPARDEASPANMKKIEDVSALDDAEVPKTTTTAVVANASPASHRFVQVATFGVPANASRTIQRFSSGGIPAVSQALTRGGKTYAIVMLGPFQDDASLKAALSAARGAGFSDAFYVR